MSLHVGLTGGIGSGKSTVAHMLVELGAQLIDADILAREVVRAGRPALAQIADAFGPGILTGSGELDRPALGAVVFGDDAARARLNAIVHPAVRAAGKDRLRAIRRADPHAIVVEDIPLLVETGAMGRFHLVIVVHTPLELRLERLTKRGMTPEQARARIAAQASEEQRTEAADILVRNDGSIEALRQQVRRVWEEVLLPYQTALCGGGTAPGSGTWIRPGGMGRALRRLRTHLPEAHITHEGQRITVHLPHGAEHSPEADTGEQHATSALLAAGFVPGAGGVFRAAEPGSSTQVRLLQGGVQGDGH